MGRSRYKQTVIRVAICVLEVKPGEGRGRATVRLRLLDETGQPMSPVTEQELRVVEDEWITAFGQDQLLNRN